MGRQTKAEIEADLIALQDAFDKLMASHRDCTSGFPFNVEWAKRVERETEAVRYGRPSPSTGEGG